MKNKCIKILYLSLMVAIIFTSCKKRDNKTDIKNDIEETINVIAYDSLILNYGAKSDIHTPINIEVRDGKVYYNNNLIYMSLNDARFDCFDTYIIAGKYFLLFNEGWYNDLNKVVNYGQVQSFISTIEETSWESKDTITDDIKKQVNNAGIYLVSGLNDEYIKALDIEKLKAYCKANFNGISVNVGGITDKDKETIKSITEELVEEYNLNTGVSTREYYDLYDEEDAEILKEKTEYNVKLDDLYKKFVLKRIGGTSPYISALSDGKYQTIDGYIVPDNKNYEYMNELFPNERYEYAEIEKRVFLLNNIGMTILGSETKKKYELQNENLVRALQNNKDIETDINTDDYYPMTIYSKGTFLPNGEPAWVERINNYETANIYGKKLYADCKKTIGDMKLYCGGTDIAFCGWSEEMLPTNDTTCDDVLNGTIEWDDRYFTDIEVWYHGRRNDDPKYLLEYVDGINKEREEAKENNNKNAKMRNVKAKRIVIKTEDEAEEIELSK